MASVTESTMAFMEGKGVVIVYLAVDAVTLVKSPASTPPANSLLPSVSLFWPSSDSGKAMRDNVLSEKCRM